MLRKITVRQTRSVSNGADPTTPAPGGLHRETGDAPLNEFYPGMIGLFTRPGTVARLRFLSRGILDWRQLPPRSSPSILQSPTNPGHTHPLRYPARSRDRHTPRRARAPAVHTSAGTKSHVYNRGCKQHLCTQNIPVAAANPESKSLYPYSDFSFTIRRETQEIPSPAKPIAPCS